ncbi:MAG: response regulator, partial [Sandaracinaceae bacterium]|nr:response regulator [Sandaracinaceae bacterium]
AARSQLGRADRADLVLAVALIGDVLGIFFVSLVTGGTDAPTLAFLPAFAVGAGLLSSSQRAAIWAVAAVVVVSLLAIGEELGLVHTLYPPLPHEWTIDIVASTTGALLVGWRGHLLATHLADESRSRAEAAEALAKSLAEARARAEQLVERRAAFLANVSHELRTPLGAVVGLTRVLEDSPHTPEQVELLRTLRASTDSLRMLVDDLLDHEAMDRGMLKVEQGVVTLRTVVADVCALFTASAAAKGLALQWHVEPKVPRRVRGDALRIRQVLSNLVSNAVKYTSEGSIDVTVSIEGVDAADPEARLVVIAVKDTGPGIDAASRALLFLPFERTASAAAKKTTGTGLGLSLGRRLAEAMGGTLDVESEPGAGATFRLHLPCIVEDIADEVPEEHSSPRASVGPSAPPSFPLEVLVVDDEPINRRVACLLVQRMGHRARDAGNAHDALEIARGQPLDVILLDYQMPDMLGPELARALARELPKPTAAMIGLTANVSEDTRRACLEAGMLFVLAKPIDVEQLGRVLERVGRRRTPGFALAPSIPPPPAPQA